MKNLTQQTIAPLSDGFAKQTLTLFDPKIIFILFFGLFSIGARAQGGGSQQFLDTNNVLVRAWAHEVDSLGSIFWKCDSLMPGELLVVHKAYTGLSADDSMHHADTAWQDSLSLLWHQAYVQYYKGVKVEFSSYTEHYTGSSVLSTNGWIVEGLNMSVTPTVSVEDALEAALDHVNADIYSWGSLDTCLYFEEDGDTFRNSSYCDNDSSSFPVGELVLINIDGDNNPTNYLLAWKFTIRALEPFSNADIYIDANNGSIITSIDNFWPSHDANTWNFGTMEIDTRWRIDDHKYYLWANDAGRAIRTREYSTDNLGEGAWLKVNGKVIWDPVRDNDDNWGTDSRNLTSTHIAVTWAWSTFAESYGHHGFDALNRQIRVLASERTDLLTGFSSSTNADNFIINKQRGYLQCSFDVVGHEFSHGVSFNTRKLSHLNETGSIGEAYGDIFGTITEKYTRPSVWDWEYGKDVGGTVRNLADPANQRYDHPNPNIAGFPDYYPTIYRGTNWFWGPDDENGAHINSSVQSYCFYLLSEGGYANAVSVDGIGIDKAGNIAFWAMVNLVEPNETHTLSREHWLHAAAVLYGRCSNEYLQTCRAWAAVGIGPFCVECNIVNPGWDWMNCYSGPPVPRMGINGIKTEPGIKVFPNPADHLVNISFKEIPVSKRIPVMILIQTLDGKEVIKPMLYSLDNDVVTIDVSNLISGMYFIVVKSENSVFSYKLAIQ